MITFAIVAIAVVALAIVALAGGMGFLLAFGDIIVFGLILWWIIRLIRRRR